MQQGLFIVQNWYYPESRHGDIGIQSSNYYFAPACRFEDPTAHYPQDASNSQCGII